MFHIPALRLTLRGWQSGRQNSQTAESSADDAEGQKDLEYLYKQFQAELGDEYLITIFRNMSPIPFQFPMCRPRWYAIGVRRMTNAGRRSDDAGRRGFDVFGLHAGQDGGRQAKLL